MEKFKVVDEQTGYMEGVTTTFSDSMEYDQGDQGGRVYFTLNCFMLPIGTKVQLSSGIPGPNPPIYIAPTTVTMGPDFTIGIVCDVPAGYRSTIYYSANFPAPPPVDASIVLRAAYVVD